MKADGVESIHNTDDIRRLECLAPGQAILVCEASGGTAIHSGSSLATPIVAGALAVVLEKEGKERTTRVESLLRGRYLSIPPTDEYFAINKKAPECYNQETGSYDYALLKKYYGFGIIHLPGMLDKWDADRDGLTDYVEYHYLDPYERSISSLDPWDPDTDGDGMNDWWEKQHMSEHGFDPLIRNDGNGQYDNGGDLDEDGLTNIRESEEGTNPQKKDSDEDTLSDTEEVNGYYFGSPEDYYWVNERGYVTTDPTNADTDNDGLADNEELTGTSVSVTITFQNGSTQAYKAVVVKTNPNKSDTDADGLSDFEEIAGVAIWTFDGETKIKLLGKQTHPLLQDMDEDELADGTEVKGYLSFFSDPRNYDSDNDGLSDFVEFSDYLYEYPAGYEGSYSSQTAQPLDPLNPDIDADGLLDGEELNRFLTSPFAADTDGDELLDGQEVREYGTNPLDLDSDDDGYFDGAELAASTDPNNPNDYPLPPTSTDFSLPITRYVPFMTAFMVNSSLLIIATLAIILSARRKRMSI